MNGDEWNNLFKWSCLWFQVIEVALGPGDRLGIYDGVSTADTHIEFTSEHNEDWDRFYQFLFSSTNRVLVTLDTILLRSNHGFQLKVCPGKDFRKTSSNKNLFHITGPLWGEIVRHRWIPPQRPVTQSFDVFFYVHMNKRLNKQWRRRWLET